MLHLGNVNQIDEGITTIFFFAQVGFLLTLPGVFQLISEFGFISGLWDFISHFLILSVYSTFHILNISSYWQRGITNYSFYLPSGRGTGLSHYFFDNMYETFYETHWKWGFIIFWMGIIVVAVSRNPAIWIVMYVLPSGIWLWGAMFLNPGSLPNDVHQEQWKRLTNKDMDTVDEIIEKHCKPRGYQKPTGFFLNRFFVGLYRRGVQGYRSLHYLYISINFAVHMRILRAISVVAILWDECLTKKIPTYVFTDEHVKVQAWSKAADRYASTYSQFYNNATGEKREIKKEQ